MATGLQYTQDVPNVVLTWWPLPTLKMFLDPPLLPTAGVSSTSHTMLNAFKWLDHWNLRLKCQEGFTPVGLVVFTSRRVSAECFLRNRIQLPMHCKQVHIFALCLQCLYFVVVVFFSPLLLPYFAINFRQLSSISSRKIYVTIDHFPRSGILMLCCRWDKDRKSVV